MASQGVHLSLIVKLNTFIYWRVMFIFYEPLIHFLCPFLLLGYRPLLKTGASNIKKISLLQHDLQTQHFPHLSLGFTFGSFCLQKLI